MATLNFPANVVDTAPTFLMGGNADVGSGIPSKAPVGITGRAVLAAATPAEALPALGLGVVHVISADTRITNAHNGSTLVMSGVHVLTINTGLASGFGCSVKGAFTHGGTATVTDVRESGFNNPWCALMETGTNTYDLIGTKG